MNIDFKTCSIYELFENKELISVNEQKDRILKTLLTREDKKEIMDNMFKYFLINIKGSILDIILSEEYSCVFDDLIKLNFKSIIKECVTSDNGYMLIRFTKNYFNYLLDNFNILVEDKNFLKNLSYFLRSIYQEKIIDKYKDKILDAILKNSTKDFKQNNYFDYLVIDFFVYLDEISDDYIEKNIEKFIIILNNLSEKINVDGQEMSEIELAFIINTIIKKANKIKEIEDFLNANVDFVISIFTNINKEELKKTWLYDFYLELIKDLLRIEKKELKDIKFKNGAFSNVIIIGDKVLKTGEKNTYEIPYNKRLLQPIIRRYIKGKKRYKNSYYEKHECVEVYERVDTKNITDDEVYLVFKELLENGILWSDAAPRNLGRLLKPNKVYLPDVLSIKKGNKEEYYVDDKEVGFLSNDKKNKEYMQKGDLVIIDMDEIYYINELDIIHKIDQDPYSVTVRDIDRLIRETYDINVSMDYVMYMERYIKEQKEKNKGKKSK